MALGFNYLAIGSASNNASATIAAVTEDNTANVGDVISIFTWTSSSLTLTSLVDSVGNTYTIRTPVVGGTDRYYWVDCKVTTPVPPGTTITATYSGTTGRKSLVAVVITGTASSYFDQQGTGSQDTSTTPNIITGTLAQADSIILGGLFVTSPLAVVTADPDYTNIDTSPVDNRTLRVDARIVSSTASDTYNPTLASSQAWVANYIVYKGDGGGGPPPDPGSSAAHFLLFGVG